jgi:thiamine-monophosphate kinase
MEKLSDIGEHEAIRRLSGMLGNHRDLLVGSGDDCAVCALPNSNCDQVFTTDPVIENIHFESLENPRRIGNKAAGRVLSDIAAMGAVPQWILVNIVAPDGLEFQVLEGIYEGINTLCNQFGATVVGGDLAKGTSLELHVFGTGLLPSGSALLRSGAKVDDCILVTGPLGGSIEGKHLDFVPRVDEGIFLRESGVVSAMMDVSDGLATDLRHILEQSNVGAMIEASDIPMVGTLDQALYDGEDFELLFTVPPKDVESIKQKWKSRFETRLVSIGNITDETGKIKIRMPNGESNMLKSKAFEHFSDNSRP